ncbi:SWIM zinc finger family protein [Nocardia crassostreae]|uniref:SWIM zinc finger family protein n=1 Tax=Nocardia crassostreae TaxID=53428 RepID=UPI000834E556|nr:SWIM zinc finger family protein [Nocardia crassostreae]
MPDNDFGYTAWGRDWVRLAEPLRMTKPEPMLPRARSIARNGLVRIEITGAMVRANIHRGSEASVTYFEVAPLPAAAVRAIAELVPAEAVMLTDEHRTAIAEAGITVSPTLSALDCSCRARGERCLHMLATCYALAMRIDENPWLALDLQGYGRILRSAGQADGTAEGAAEIPPPRWIPIDTLDPATFFEVTAP